MNTDLKYVEQSISTHRKLILALQRITILSMCVEAGVAVFAALRAHSAVLLGFGVDSGIELLSAFVVFLRLKNIAHLDEQRAARIAGVLLFALAAFILGSSIVALTNPRFRPEPSYLGIALLVAASLFMPWLSAQKRRLATSTHSGSLKADAVQSAMCAYLAWIALGGLLINALFKVWWADPAAALLLMPIVIREGWEATQGKSCADCEV